MSKNKETIDDKVTGTKVFCNPSGTTPMYSSKDEGSDVAYCALSEERCSYYVRSKNKEFCTYYQKNKQ